MNFKSDSALLKSYLKYLTLKERYEEISALKKEAEKIRSQLTKEEDLPQILEAWKKLAMCSYPWPPFEEIEAKLLDIHTGTLSATKGQAFLKPLFAPVNKDLEDLKYEMKNTELAFSDAFTEAYENFASKKFHRNGAFMTSVMKLPTTEKFFIDFLLS